jgi:UDP-N-acetylglucosamine acyltransferase
MIHHSAIISDKAIIGNNVTIGAYTVIHDNVTIKDNTYIGEHCNIGSPAEYRSTYPQKAKGVFIGANTTITGHVTIDAGVFETTSIGSNCFLMKHSHVGHDAILQEGVTLSCGAKIGGHTVIMKRANIGLNAVIHQKTVVGSYCMIGMGAVVTRKLCVSPFGKWVGNPAKQIGDNEHPSIKELSIVESIHEHNNFISLFDLSRTW